MESIWTSGVERPHFESLNHDVKTDVLVVGGGIAGILCTYMLKKSGVDCVLVEANRIGCGITQNTTAKITCQHGLIYDKMIKRFGSETAKLYFVGRWGRTFFVNIHDSLTSPLSLKVIDTILYL